MDHEPFHERKIDFYFIEDFQKKGYKVEYWSLCDILPYMRKAKFNYRIEKEYVYYINTLNELFGKLETLNPKNDLLIVEFWYLYSTKSIFKKITIKGLKWIRIDYYLNPTKSLIQTPSFIDKLKALNFKTLLDRSINWAFNRFDNHEFEIPDLLFITGQSQEYINRAKKLVSLDYFDVIEYEKKKDEISILSQPYIVYLDMMILDHPDIIMLGKENMISKSAYYREINEVFDKIERCTGLMIVIASHPKAVYKNEFGNRLVLANRTAELAIHSEMVITHGSLAISYALLAGKPIIYLNLEKLFLKNDFLKSVYRNMQLGKDLIGATIITEDVTCDNLNVSVDLKKYQNYLAKYFCKTEKNMSNFNIVFNEILNLMDEN